jgi:molybdopterin synthase sulfur carrier subunit
VSRRFAHLAVLRLFASAREAAGIDRVTIAEDTVGAVLASARSQFGTPFSDVLAHSRVWCNGEPAADTDRVGPGDEVAVLPPVSGGAA